MADKMAKPFLKWAGGKTQLIKDIEKALPNDIKNDKFTYIEPFVGSGAVLFWMLNKFPKITKAVINDINEDLINTYKIIASKPYPLISVLQELQNEYHSLERKDEKKKEYYYSKRETYNSRNTDNIVHAALFIFLNRTCFNGLYRVNSKGEFNVPVGDYVNPIICDEQNLLAAHQILQIAEIKKVDYKEIISDLNGQSFIYFDPPYRPISKTASFNAYSKHSFGHNEQVELANLFRLLDKKGMQLMLSNSDPKNIDPSDNFFDEIYNDFNITRVPARRMINSDSTKRGIINEIVVTNYSIS